MDSHPSLPHLKKPSCNSGSSLNYSSICSSSTSSMAIMLPKKTKNSKLFNGIHKRIRKDKAALGNSAASGPFVEDDRIRSNQATIHNSYNFRKDKSFWWRFEIPFLGQIRLNPIVSFVSVVLIWSFVALCISYGQELPFAQWKRSIVEKFTWLYIGSQDLWMIFLLVLYFSKYSSLNLGKPNDKPEYSNATWFMMLFACGIGVGLFFFGVSEPLYHYIGPNRYYADKTMPDNNLAQMAMTLTFYHWGIHGWLPYTLVGLLLAIVAHRENLPMTMKSCFYPLLGDKIFGWMGDLIDMISIITTLFGVCTSLGLGSKQLNTGIHIMFSSIPSNNVNVQVIIIWCVTAVATISTVSGLNFGIRRLSEICFTVGIILMFSVLFLDNSSYLLGLFVQSLGNFIHIFPKLAAHTDAFVLQGPSYGSIDRNRDSQINLDLGGSSQTDGPNNWMNSWTMFYWGWWISWSPFVGMFIAKVSKGRTIREFLNGVMVAPVLYTFMWLVIFGGAGLRMEREAAGNGLCCHTNQAWFKSPENLYISVTHQNINLKSLNATSGALWMCGDNTKCGKCAQNVLQLQAESNQSYDEFLANYRFLGDDFGSTSSDRRFSRLSCHSTEQMWFDVLRSYGDIGNLISTLSLLGIVLYFVTSSDSGSLIIDCLSSNGDPEPPTLQRIFWSLTEGATATALIIAGGKEGLETLQTIGIVSGLPFTLIICLLCSSIWKAVNVGAGNTNLEGPAFKIGLFEPFATAPYSDENLNESLCALFPRWMLQIILAPWTAAMCHAKLNSSNNVLKYAWPYLVVFFISISLMCCEILFRGALALGCVFYIVFIIMLTCLRVQGREKLEIEGNIIEDFFACLVMYPSVLLQLEDETRHIEKINKRCHEMKLSNDLVAGARITTINANGHCNGRKPMENEIV